MKSNEVLALAKECFTYDPETGIFRVKARRYGSNKLPGEQVGTNSGKGYLSVNLAGRIIKLHRLAWAFTYDKWPSGEIDHINGNRADNRVANLRDVNATIQGRNRVKNKNNRSGISGVLWDERLHRWRVRLADKYIGIFPSVAEAMAAKQHYLQTNPELGFTERHGQ